MLLAIIIVATACAVVAVVYLLAYLPLPLSPLYGRENLLPADAEEDLFSSEDARLNEFSFVGVHNGCHRVRMARNHVASQYCFDTRF